jgi:hypothetical protein
LKLLYRWLCHLSESEEAALSVAQSVAFSPPLERRRRFVGGVIAFSQKMKPLFCRNVDGFATFTRAKTPLRRFLSRDEAAAVSVALSQLTH